MTVMSMGLTPAAAGGGFQHWPSLSQTSLMFLTGVPAGAWPFPGAGELFCACAAQARAMNPNAAIHLTCRIDASHTWRQARLLHVGGNLDFHHLVGIGHGPARRAGRRLLQLVD